MPAELPLQSRSPSDTQAIAAAVASALRAGDVVALTGELGAGKTCFVQGAARALGVGERVTSPSFVLRREYAGRLPVLHLDVYRLETLSQVEDLGYEQVLDRTRVTFIEWGDAMAPLLPAEHLECELNLPPVPASAPTAADEPEPRRIVLRPHGEDWRRRLSGLSAALSGWRCAPPAGEAV